MVIRKPYAFIIKNFKIIHLVLFLLMFFVCYKCTLIFSFFNNYATKEYVEYYENFSSHFVGFGIFFVILLIIASNLILMYLLKLKNKRTKYYVINIVYYVILTILLIVIKSVFSKMNYKTSYISVKDAIAIRDIIIFVLIPQFVTTIYCLLRGVGFDLKSFNFKKDLIELEILEEDSEEIEIVVPKDTYKIMRVIRKTIREAKYFILEHRLIFTILVSVIGVVFLVVIIIDRSVYTNKYKESDDFSVNGITLKINKSYLTDINYAGNVINKKYYYLVLDVNMKNTTRDRVKFKIEDLPLIANDETYYPLLSKNENFIDYGNGFNTINQLEPNESYKYLLIYELPVSNYRKMYVKLVSAYMKNGKSVVNKRNIYVAPKKVLKESIRLLEQYNLNEEVLFGESNLKKSSITIKNYEIQKEFNYKYEYYNSLNSQKQEGIITVKPDFQNQSSLIMKVESDYNIDNELFMSKYLTNSQNLLSYFGSIKYKVNGTDKAISKLDVVDLKLDSKYLSKSTSYITVPKELQDAESITLVFTVRNVKYEIKLK